MRHTPRLRTSRARRLSIVPRGIPPRFGNKDIRMTSQQGKRLGGILFLGAAAAFFVAAALADQPPFFGVGVAMFSVGIAFIAQSRKGT